VGRRGTPMDDALRPVDLDRRPVGLHRADLTAGGQRIPAEDSAAAKYEVVEVIQKNAPPCCGTSACAGRRCKRSMPRTLECGWDMLASGGKSSSLASDWATIEINGAQRIIHRRPSLSNFVLPVEVTGSLSAIAAKKKRPTASCCQSGTRTVRLRGHAQFGTRR